MKVVSLYVDQKPEGDLSESGRREFGFRVYPTIAEAPCCGGKSWRCDAVLIIGEHGDYPRNEKGQILYPRYRVLRTMRQGIQARAAARCRFTTISTVVQLRKRRRRWWSCQRTRLPNAGRLVVAGDVASADVEMPLERKSRKR